MEVMQKLDNLESSDHLKMAFAPAQPDFVPFDVAERRKKIFKTRPEEK